MSSLSVAMRAVAVVVRVVFVCFVVSRLVKIRLLFSGVLFTLILMSLMVVMLLLMLMQTLMLMLILTARSTGLRTIHDGVVVCKRSVCAWYS